MAIGDGGERKGEETILSGRVNANRALIRFREVNFSREGGRFRVEYNRVMRNKIAVGEETGPPLTEKKETKTQREPIIRPKS